MSTNHVIRFPPEWADQSAVLIAWPYPKGDFAHWLDQVEAVYIHIALAVSQRQSLIIAVKDGIQQSRVSALLGERNANLPNILFVTLPYDDVWVRDTAPLSVQSGQGAKLLDFRFNGWGNKYEHAEDARLARRLHASGIFGATPFETIDFVLEGGSIETDGAGTLLTTTRCLLNPNRNPEYDRTGIEHRLRTALGVHRILWLQHGYVEGDDTDAHVDTLARFCAPDTIAHTTCEDPADPMYAELKAMENELKQFTSPSGEPYKLVPLPVPRPIHSEEGKRLPATYANFLILNGAVLVPVYDDPADEIALVRLAGCFPNREMVAVPSKPLIRQYGSIHCMTMQFPSSVTVRAPT